MINSLAIWMQPPVYNHFRMYAERLCQMVVDDPLLFDGNGYRMDFEGLERILKAYQRLG